MGMTEKEPETQEGNYELNILTFLLMVAVPAACWVALLSWLKDQYNIDMDWATPMAGTMPVLFAFEVVAHRLSKKTLWSSLSTSRDKVVVVILFIIIFVSIIGPLYISQLITSRIIYPGMPVYSEKPPFPVSLISLLVGFGISWVIVQIFGTPELKTRLREKGLIDK